MLVIVRAALPLLVSLTVEAALDEPTSTDPKLMLAGDKTTQGPSTPVPDKAITCGLLRVPSVSVKAPLRLPVAVGVKVTEAVQCAPELRIEEQSLVTAKSLLATRLETLNGTAPELVMVIGRDKIGVRGWT